ncbi:hypothetical protein [Anaerotruncus colihominis]|uniref:hypothetical protein n=1 Tax=Anaerotruncus colihominis TaxID=169435 RepID=UPI0024305D46|nr:hypothetical protein [Anaerotruncus colihominis]
MPERQKYTAFHIINTVIRNLLEPKKRTIYKNAGEYLIAIYGWVEDFREKANELKRNYPKAGEKYFHAVYTGGLIVLEDNLVHSNDTDCFLAKLSHRTKNEMMRYRLENNLQTRQSAISALKEHLATVYGKTPEVIVPQMVKKAADELKKRNSAYYYFPANELLKYSDSARTEDEWFDVWAILLIYAQSELLPSEPPVMVNFQPNCNIFMSSKKAIQDMIPLEERCGGAQRITLINYAGTGLIAGPIITHEVRGEWKHFFYNISYGGTKVRIVLTDPSSSAAEDAIACKMRPLTLQPDISLDNIIPKNLSVLKEYMLSFPQADIEVYLTKSALPCAYMKSEFEDERQNNIKIDLYLPTFSSYSNNSKLLEPWQCDDQLRQSFMIYKKFNPELYEVFSRNMEEIIRHSHPAFEEE